MEDINLKQLTLAVRAIAEEKNLPEETVLSVIEQAIAAAWRRDNGEREQNVRAELNTVEGTAKVFVIRTVVEEVENPVKEISLDDAKKIKPEIELGDVIEDEHKVTSFGRSLGTSLKVNSCLEFSTLLCLFVNFSAIVVRYCCSGIVCSLSA